MLTSLFHTYGHMCASRPWEVIIGTITATVCLMSMSFFSEHRKICGWNYQCSVTEVLSYCIDFVWYCNALSLVIITQICSLDYAVM